MRRIGVLYNPLSEESIQLSESLSRWLRALGLEVWRGVSQEGRAEPSVLENMDLLVALGGDGTVLRAAHLSIALSHCSVPILPVALGHLNFMAELAPDEVYDGMTTLLRGGGWYDERTLLVASIQNDNLPPRSAIALNEVLVARGEINRVVLVDIEIYDNQFTSYHADGVLVATATGSTAYALSAGGPVIDPRSRAMLLVPVAAHLTSVPSLVLHEDATVRMRLRGRHPAVFSADGHPPIPLGEGDWVEVRRAPQTCIFARVHEPSTFYARLVRRLRRDH